MNDFWVKAINFLTIIIVFLFIGVSIYFGLEGSNQKSDISSAFRVQIAYLTHNSTQLLNKAESAMSAAFNATP